LTEGFIRRFERLQEFQQTCTTQVGWARRFPVQTFRIENPRVHCLPKAIERHVFPWIGVCSQIFVKQTGELPTYRCHPEPKAKDLHFRLNFRMGGYSGTIDKTDFGS